MGHLLKALLSACVSRRDAQHEGGDDDVEGEHLDERGEQKETHEQDESDQLDVRGMGGGQRSERDEGYLRKVEGHRSEGLDETAAERRKNSPHVRLKCKCYISRLDPKAMSSYDLQSLLTANPGLEAVRARRQEAETRRLMGSRQVTIEAEEEERAQRGGAHQSGTEELLHRPEVPLQISYTGIAPAIPAALANIPCATLGVDELLDKLNDVLQTAYALDRPGLRPELQACIDRGFDFGMAYGRLRRFWHIHSRDFALLQQSLARFELQDAEERKKAVQKETNWVKNLYIPPRRIWDLYSNRVIPWWCFSQRYDLSSDEKKGFQALSHSWMAETQRRYINTSINAYEWPVPIPIDTTLDRVRIELLNYGCEYAWLDVLCLRQEGSRDASTEAARKEEWKLDVPTIGIIYRARTTVTYFSGLGRPFHIDDLGSERHWLNRAWTMQEASKDAVIAGLVADSPFPPAVDAEGQIQDPIVGQFYTLFANMATYYFEFEPALNVLHRMRGRSASHEVDNVAGLAYCLDPAVLPVYVRSASADAAEEAWDRLVETMSGEKRTEMLFQYPTSGDRTHAWKPSWTQINTRPLPWMEGHETYGLQTEVVYSAAKQTHTYEGHCLREGMIEGLAEADAEGYCREGTMKVVHKGVEHSFLMTAHHQEPIIEGHYFLIGNHDTFSSSRYKFWMVGQKTKSGSVRKVSVLRMEGEKDRLRISEFTKKKRVILI